MLIETLSVFPGVFDAYLGASIMGRAQKKGIFEFRAHDLRDWTHDRHRTVDDAPFGGGQGMLMKPAPIFEAVNAIKAADDRPARVIFFTPVGTPFTQREAERLSREDRLIFVCGRYEGMDERVYSLADETLSLGDYVLTGGELPAMVESFSDDGLLEYAQYTRPADYDGMAVPEVLLSGDHARVNAWRRRNAIERTARLRPDLLESANITDDEREFAHGIMLQIEPEGEAE